MFGCRGNKADFAVDYGVRRAMTKSEKIFYLILIVLAILIIGVQIGIAHGKRLQIEYIRSDYEYICSN